MPRHSPGAMAPRTAIDPRSAGERFVPIVGYFCTLQCCRSKTSSGNGIKKHPSPSVAPSFSVAAAGIAPMIAGQPSKHSSGLQLHDNNNHNHNHNHSNISTSKSWASLPHPVYP